MRIAGLQPLSLLDFPGRVAAVVFTQGCPFRCVYCHNPELIAPQGKNVLETEDVLDRIGERKLFLDGVVVTGGEPTVHHDLPEFLSELKSMGLETKLDTNGVHPRMIERIIQEGLADFFAMDLKHVWRDYGSVIGTAARAATENCIETMRIIRSSGIASEFRTTVYPYLQTEDDLVEIAENLGTDDCYVLQEIRYEKTLQTHLPRAPNLDLNAVAERIRASKPGLRVEIRA
ncbi:MAG: anaerobic ribonucleoside-triphosphate reductase activating protein [Patescibacteria group bacterium]|nr:MAG: anaerobic ribonucleoside-triphosphate reductase activating protein [Patescibacteria group bacterium]